MFRLLEYLADAVEKAVESSDKERWSSSEGMGADGTETSGIDKIAEDALISALERKGNPMNLLSEESGFLDFGREKTLIADPIDGTYNAIRGIPFYSVSLVIAENSMSDASFALVRNLAAKDEFRAEKGKGAWRNGERIRTRKFSMDDLIFSVSPARKPEERTWKVAGIPKRLRALGSASLEISAVASGSLDLYYCVSKSGMLRIVDIAAASLILREAGGEIYNGELIPLNMDFDIRKRESVIAAGDSRVLEVIK